jgi:hypothetical protein
MRGKRSKQYRKLMQQYALGFGFREPYQVIVTSDIIEDAARFQMDLTGGISRTLHGEVKPREYISERNKYPQSFTIAILKQESGNFLATLWNILPGFYTALVRI